MPAERVLRRDFHCASRPAAVDVYADEAAYLAHLNAPQTQWLIDALDGVLVGPPRGAFHHKICDKSDFLTAGTG